MTDMTYTPLGDSGLMVSTVGLGCNNFGAFIDARQTRSVVGTAIDAGINLFDTADVYGSHPGESEELLGQALGTRRDDVLVATKFGMDARGANGVEWGTRGSRRYIRQAVTASLRRLNTDYIDLYQMHEPDPITPIEETLTALHELVQEGKVRYIGSSNFAGWQIVDADWTAQAAGFSRFISAQNEYSLLNRKIEREVIPAAEQVGASVIPYFPLASGLLTGKYQRGSAAPVGTRLEKRKSRLAEANFDRIEAIGDYARQRGVSMLDVAMGGLSAQPGVASIIAGATRPEQVRENVKASLWTPTAEDLVALDEIAPVD